MVVSHRSSLFRALLPMFACAMLVIGCGRIGFDGVAPPDAATAVDAALQDSAPPSDTSPPPPDGSDGWEIVSQDSFDLPPTGDWSTTARAECGAFGWVLGPFLGPFSAELGVAPLRAHSSVRIRARFVFLDSWDNGTTDFGYIDVDGGRAWQAPCANDRSECGRDVSRVDQCGSPWLDSDVAVELVLPHVSASLSLVFGAGLDQGDEGFAVADVEVSIR